MKKIIFIMYLMSIFLHAERSPTEGVLEEQLAIVKSQTTVDTNDTRVFDLLERMYEELLQSDDLPASSKKTFEIFSTYLNDKTMPNAHILFLFTYYQQYITSTAAQGKATNPKIQMSIMTHLQNALREYPKIPTIIMIYSAEAAMSDKRYTLAVTTLKQRSDSIPAKVYLSLLLADTKEGKAHKEDLIKNHSTHWLVKEKILN